MKITILIVNVLGGLVVLGPLAQAGSPLSLQKLRELETKQGAVAEVESLCDAWKWDLIDASVFVEKDFAGDKSYMVDRASVTDRRTGESFIVGIVIDKYTGNAKSMPDEYFAGFLATGEIPPLYSASNPDAN